MSRESTYSVRVADGGDGEDEKGEKQDEVLSRYLQDLRLARANAVPASQVFSPFVAWSNRVLLGILYFGGGDQVEDRRATTGLVFWKYFSFHLWMIAAYTLMYGPILNLVAVPKSLAFLFASLLVAPMLLGTPFAERKIFGSAFLAARILRGGKEVDAVHEGCTCKSFWAYSVYVCFSFAFAIIPGVFLVIPYANRVSDSSLVYCFWVTLGMLVVMNFAFFSLAKWQPLVEMHQKEVIDGARLTSDQVMRVLFDKKLSPPDARRQLSMLTTKLVQPLRSELAVWSFEVNSLMVNMLVSLCIGVYILFSPDQNNAEPRWAGELIRYALSVHLAMWTPLQMWGLLDKAAKPHHEWSRITQGLMDAENVAAAQAKFDGSWHALESWLDKNRLTLRLIGFSVDDGLPGRLAAGLGGLLGAIGIVVARVTGLY